MPTIGPVVHPSPLFLPLRARVNLAWESLVYKPLWIQFPLLLRSAELEVELREYLRYDLCHFHNGDILAYAGMCAGAELETHHIREDHYKDKNTTQSLP